MTHRPVYIWPGGHLHGSRLCNASLPAHCLPGFCVYLAWRSFILFTPRQCKPAGSLPARLLRIFGLAAIYTVHASAMQACRLIACPASAYIWPGGHLYCSRLGNASLPAHCLPGFCVYLAWRPFTRFTPLQCKPAGFCDRFILQLP